MSAVGVWFLVSRAFINIYIYKYYIEIGSVATSFFTRKKNARKKNDDFLYIIICPPRSPLTSISFVLSSIPYKFQKISHI